jgi:glutamate N-acetyltransferase / amino-acid N-acetyltransferase
MRWPDGVRSSGTACGIKPGGAHDLGVITFEEPTPWAGVFTLNAAAAAPVMWCREHLGAPVRAVVVNSGNANACTGRFGAKAVATTASAAAAAARCDPNEVLVASTGPIGIELPVTAIENALPGAVASTNAEVEAFAGAITTTDTVIKTSSHPAGAATVVGVAKGAAMIAPNMATMLAFLATDAAADTGLLHATLAPAVGRTFNRISIDACESTNDSVFLFATGTAGRAHPDDLAKAVEAVCADLAEQIVRDSEGSGKFVRIRIAGAPSEESAAAAGRAVAASALWRAAVGGGDPNWGRVISALGASDRSLDVTRISLSIGGVALFVDGEPTGALRDAAETMSAEEITVDCSIGSGPGAAEVLSADLTEEYVRLNAEGTS